MLAALFATSLGWAACDPACADGLLVALNAVDQGGSWQVRVEGDGRVLHDVMSLHGITPDEVQVQLWTDGELRLDETRTVGPYTIGEPNGVGCGMSRAAAVTLPAL